jgi:N-acetylglutamate synthase-like GNAT family acetyltransferase
MSCLISTSQFKMPTATLPRFRIETADWRLDSRALRAVRAAVFLQGTGSEQARDCDRHDAQAQHLVARGGDPPLAVGALRWLQSGQIEWLGVLPAWRRQGVGRSLLACAVRDIGHSPRVSPWLWAPAQCQGFFAELGFVAAEAAPDQHASLGQRLVLAQPEALMAADLGARLLGVTSGRVILGERDLLVLAVTQLAGQARRCIELLSADLQPAIYDQGGFLEAVRQLALELRGRLPVRILVIDPEPALRRGHRLIELARQMSSDVQIRVVPQDWAERCDQFLLCDQDGYSLTRYRDPRRTLVDFNDGAQTRRLRRLFDQIWEQGESHPGLRRLYL